MEEPLRVEGSRPIGEERHLSAILQVELGVDVELDPTIGTKVEVVNPVDRPFQLGAIDRTFERQIEASALGRRSDLPPAMDGKLAPYAMIAVVRSTYS